MVGAARGTWFGLVRMTDARAEWLGRTTRVEVEPVGSRRYRITTVVPGRPVRLGALYTTLAEWRRAPHLALLAEGPPDDTRTGDVLAWLADHGLLFGVELAGEILDIGIPTGYADAPESRAPAPRARNSTRHPHGSMRSRCEGPADGELGAPCQIRSMQPNRSG